MKYFFVPLVSIALLAMACTNNKSGNSAAQTDSVATLVPATEKLCFLGTANRDSVRLELKRTGSDFNGFLFYDRYESDSSIGEYNGKVSGDTLKGVFNFMSEGMISNVDKYFLMKDGNLLEGIGPLTEKDSISLVFTDTARVKFGESYILQPATCADEFISRQNREFYYKLKTNK